MKYENPQTANMSKVLQDCHILQQLLGLIGNKTLREATAGVQEEGRVPTTEELQQKTQATKDTVSGQC